MGRINYRVSLVASVFLFAAYSVSAQDNAFASGIGELSHFTVHSISIVHPAQDVEKLVPQDTYALPWETIMESNILWKKRVWRDIDANNAANNVFGYNTETAPGNNLVNIMIDGFFKAKYKAYSAADDRFTTELSKEAFIALLANDSKTTVTGFNPSQVTKFRIKEDWLFLEKEHKMVVRILGIAPLVDIAGADGKLLEQPAFWLYYPDSRSYFAEHPVYNGRNAGSQNWDQLFESRNFSSVVSKVSDNSSMYSGYNHPVNSNK